MFWYKTRAARASSDFLQFFNLFDLWRFLSRAKRRGQANPKRLYQAKRSRASSLLSPGHKGLRSRYQPQTTVWSCRYGVQLLKEDDISVCSQDTGLYDEKKKTITTGKRRGGWGQKHGHEDIPSKKSKQWCPTRSSSTWERYGPRTSYSLSADLLQ